MENTKSSKTALEYYLGAEDILRIVEAILPKLAKYLPDKTKDEQYVFLVDLVNKYSKDKTYSNKPELDKLVQTIVNKTANQVIAVADGSGSVNCGGKYVIKSYSRCGTLPVKPNSMSSCRNYIVQRSGKYIQCGTYRSGTAPSTAKSCSTAFFCRNVSEVELLQ